MALNKESKDLIWTERINRILLDWSSFSRGQRAQFRMDTKALLCRGLEKEEVNQI